MLYIITGITSITLLNVIALIEYNDMYENAEVEQVTYQTRTFTIKEQSRKNIIIPANMVRSVSHYSDEEIINILTSKIMKKTIF